MKYFILIDKHDANTNNNVLAMETAIDEGLEKLNSDDVFSENEINAIAEHLKEGKDLPTDIPIKILTLDDSDISIPVYDRLVLIIENGKPYKFFGNYANYVLGLYADDICAKNKYDVTNIEEYSEEKDEYSVNVELTDGSHMMLGGVFVDKFAF